VGAVWVDSQGAALAQAVASGDAVVVGSSLTERSRLLANPDGSLTYEASSVPVAVKLDVDATPVVGDDVFHDADRAGEHGYLRGAGPYLG
jgi:hypothetical protein